jgi:hypothetical protein
VSEEPEQPRDGGEPVATGNAVVDEVLGSLEGLEDLPVAEHVAVFEAAHEALRATLADAGGREGVATGR